MNANISSSSTRSFVEVTDEEHSLILILRTMQLEEIICVINLNKFFPEEVPDKHRHVTNIINLYFNKSYETHTIKSMIDFISMQPTFTRMFQQHSVKEMIEKYEAHNIAESVNVHELYLHPFTTKCIQCETMLKESYKHRPKTVMSLTRNYKACKS